MALFFYEVAWCFCEGLRTLTEGGWPVAASDSRAFLGPKMVGVRPFGPFPRAEKGATPGPFGPLRSGTAARAPSLAPPARLFLIALGS
eukprot:NODE_4633_length_782_cov_3.538881_g3852_i0.p2 GENE.NODE_4633_length_782_cov_3.538881_g3852_i0~~NODE_4633_length_782_cov_3.538881_g3852_i0.p2  ORF type:complete len:88 (+),score=0.39 NODE_4633_length_782_cov_3.538881_g3852_i0:64-327(+)